MSLAGGVVDAWNPWHLVNAWYAWDVETLVVVFVVVVALMVVIVPAVVIMLLVPLLSIEHTEDQSQTYEPFQYEDTKRTTGLITTETV